MSHRKIIHQNERLYLLYSKKEDTHALQNVKRQKKYTFGELEWYRGVIPSKSITYQSKINVNKSAPYMYSDYSMTYAENRPFIRRYGVDPVRKKLWEKRKIIHSIEVNVKNNICEKYQDALGWSIAQVKKSVFHDSWGSWLGHYNALGQYIYFANNQFSAEPTVNFHNKSKKFDNLSYHLPADEDFMLLQDIKFKDNYFMLDTTYNMYKSGDADKPYIEYDIDIVYSDGYV